MLSGGPSTSCDLWIAVAGFDGVEDMNAAGTTRRGRRAVDGFAVKRWV